jgi:hypothetical protein
MEPQERMVVDKDAAENIFVFMHTNTFNNDPSYSNGASARFSETTNDTGEVVALAVRLGERLWRDGFRYTMCGVMITEPMPETIRQPALWGELDREKRERAWKPWTSSTPPSGAIPSASLEPVPRMLPGSSGQSIARLDGPRDGMSCRTCEHIERA